ERSTSDRRSHVVSLTERGREAVAEAADMERSVLASASIDPDVLRQELQAVVRELANRMSSPEAKALVSDAEPGMAVQTTQLS
ncbi:MAG: MarR family transcriptional regulator, organic hydroperoxide resistance regulator, partial [Actinomycetota bacterium]|nr:MarR family transcriptional regulator, organic hydroperoxide resistance regulator [Actinomycetota bacterium]